MCGENGTCVVFGTGAPTVVNQKPLIYRVYYDTAAANKVYVGTGTAWLAVTASPPAGGGDVVGPAVAVNGDIALFDGVTGKLIKDSGLTPGVAITSPNGTITIGGTRTNPTLDAEIAVDANDNVFSFTIGALASNTTGNDNVALGTDALGANTTGRDNVGIGDEALLVNTTGKQNVGLGPAALHANTTGDNNVALGNNPLKFNTTGTENVGIGTSAVGTMATGVGNVGIGGLALANATNNDNVGIGHHAGEAITTGANNVAIGPNTNAGTTGSGNVVIGTGITVPDVTASNQINIADQITSDNVTLEYKGNTITSGHGAQVAVAGAATLNQGSGIITSEALVGAVTYTLTLTNNVVLVTSTVIINATNSAGLPVTLTSTAEANGSVVIIVGMAALTGTVKIRFAVFN